MITTIISEAPQRPDWLSGGAFGIAGSVLTTLVCGTAMLAMVLPNIATASAQDKGPTEHVTGTRSQLSAEAFLRGIYAHYRERCRIDGCANPGPWQRAATLFTPTTIAVIDAHQKLLTEVGVIDGDPFCDCQEWLAITVDRVSTTAVAPDRAEAIVNFHDQDGRAKAISFRLQRESDGWRIDDMTLLGASPDGWLVTILQNETVTLKESEWSREP